MDTKKDIGSQVKTVLENQTVSPDSAIWENLEVELKKKKKKRKAFFLYLSSGLTSIALLVFILFGTNLIFDSNKSKSTIDKNITNDHFEINNLENTINNSQKTSNYSTINDLDYSTINDLDYSTNDSIKTATNPNRISSNHNNNHSQQSNNRSINSSLSESNNESNRSNTSKNTRSSSVLDRLSKNATSNSYKNKSSSVNYSIVKHNISGTSQASIINTKKAALLSKNSKTTNGSKTKNILKNDQGLINEGCILSDNKNNIINKEDVIKITDSTLVKDITIADLKKKEEEKEAVKKYGDEDKKDEKDTSNKWSVYPHGSLDIYNSFDQSFSNNATLNYGIYFNYHASDKFVLRLGVNNLNFKYNQFVNNEESIQTINYLEIPLEAKYQILDKKIQVSTTFGFSNYILNEARLMTNQDTIDNETFFNKNNLSLNVGLELQATLSKRFSLNAEPNFKYHLIPYKNEFSFSIFTTSVLIGIEYKF